MKKLRILFLFLISFGFYSACTQQKTTHQTSPDSDDIKAEFMHAWNGYKAFAWGKDDLRPISNSYHNWYDHSLLMTPVDAYDTMLLMGLEDEAEEAKALIFEQLSFNHDIFVQNFEITIRLFGGLLSAYQMDGDERFLELATDLANRLLPVFDSPTGMPYVNVNLKTGETSGTVNNPAEIGTLMLEFGTLSKLTGDPKYYDHAKKGMMELFDRRSKIGLVGTTINVETGEWQNTESHISGMIDSWYEYLLKSWILFEDDDFKTMYDVSIQAVLTYLVDETDNGTWFQRVDMNTGEQVSTHYGALEAFMPGVLVLDERVELAKAVQESNYKMWNLHGIEPETIDYSTMEVLNASYYLRPENIESAYYLYLETGDEYYQEMGLSMYGDIIKYCKTESGFAELSDVRTKEQHDAMQSFFLAETLKYSYLLASDMNLIDHSRTVFNTEAHPLTKTW